MIVISAGMQKSGSAYIYNLINDILIKSGKSDAREIKEKYKLHDIMKMHNNNIGGLRFKLLLKLIRVSFAENVFVVKTHSRPSWAHNLFLKLGLLKTVYIFRDPRDVLLSAQDHGRKIIAKGELHTFAELVDFDNAFRSVKKWVNVYEEYADLKGVLCISYEDLMERPEIVLNKVTKYLGITLSQEVLSEIMIKYDRKNPDANMTGLHFNQAKTKRHLTELSKSELSGVKQEIGNVLDKMNYQT